MYFSAVAPYTNASRIIHYSFSDEGGVFVNYDKSVLQVVCKRIQKLRQQKCFTQQQFSEMVGISTNYLSDLERGVSSPRMDKLVAIINALGCSADEVFADVLENGYQIRASRLTDELVKLQPQEQERAFAILEAFIRSVK